MARTHIVAIGPYRDMCKIARITKLLSQVKIHTFVKVAHSAKKQKNTKMLIASLYLGLVGATPSDLLYSYCYKTVTY
jgi:hypothetical protein